MPRVCRYTREFRRHLRLAKILMCDDVCMNVRYKCTTFVFFGKRSLEGSPSLLSSYFVVYLTIYDVKKKRSLRNRVVTVIRPSHTTHHQDKKRRKPEGNLFANITVNVNNSSRHKKQNYCNSKGFKQSNQTKPNLTCRCTRMGSTVTR